MSSWRTIRRSGGGALLQANELGDLAAGGPRKCDFVKQELGFDVAVDHRAADFPSLLATACPDGIDVYFESVGGAVWLALLSLLNQFARVPVCGLIAQYDGE